MNELNVAQIKFILNQNNVGERRSIIVIVNFECSYIVFLFQVSSKSGPTTVSIYLFKVNNRNTRKKLEICLRLTIKKTVVGSQQHRLGFFVNNFGHVLYFALLFSLLILSK